MDAHKIIAVIPAFNEERFIASVVLNTENYAQHIIVIDDGSSDNTALLAASAGAEVIRHKINKGKAQALNTGFKAALNHNPDVIVCLDADAQHKSSDIPTVAKAILDGTADVVIGSRFLTTKNKIPKWRQVGQHSLTALTNTLSKTNITDSQSGFRAFSPTAARALNFKTGGLSVESEMQFLFEPAGLKVSEVPISVSYQDGNKRNPIIHGLNILDSLLSLVARRRPLAFITFPGIALSLLGFFLGLRVLVSLQTSGQLAIGTALLTVLFFVVGVMLAMTGVTLHSIGHFTTRIKEEIQDSTQKANLSTAELPYLTKNKPLVNQESQQIKTQATYKSIP